MTKGQRLFVILNVLFVAFLLLAEFTGSKLFQFGGFTMTLGVIPFPMTFILTDILNEFWGRKGIRFTTLLGMIALAAVYLVILLDLQIPAMEGSPVSDQAFQAVFANSGAIILGSVVAYLIGQLIDIQIFHFLRRRTKNRHIWLRATGSTIVSQLLDSFIVIYIAFGSGIGSVTFPAEKVISISATNFVYKLLVAIAITPLIYLGHHWIERYLGKEAHDLQERAQLDTSFPITVYPG